MAILRGKEESMSEYLRPWKLASLAAGVFLLIVGAYHYAAFDWDVPISIIMALLTYVFAPWSLRVVLERRWRQLPAALAATWFTIDGNYWMYWHFQNPAALELMREANFFASRLRSAGQ
jgi:hypothetical protein